MFKGHSISKTVISSLTQEILRILNTVRHSMMLRISMTPTSRGSVRIHMSVSGISAVTHAYTSKSPRIVVESTSLITASDVVTVSSAMSSRIRNTASRI